VPVTEAEKTISLQTDIHTALKNMQQLASDSPMVTASSFYDGKQFVRLAGVSSAVDAAATRLGGDADDNAYWNDLREQQLAFFNQSKPLWRISVPALTPELDIDGSCLYDWAGMQRWLYSEDSAENIRSEAHRHGGHATLFKAEEVSKQSTGTFHPPASAIMQLHRNLKQEFDPHGIFNPGRLYPDL